MASAPGRETSAAATNSASGVEVMNWVTYLPRPPQPMRPSRTFSFAPMTRAAEAAVSRNPLRSIAELFYAFAPARPSTQWRMTRSTQNRGKVFDRNPR